MDMKINIICLTSLVIVIGLASCTITKKTINSKNPIIKRIENTNPHTYSAEYDAKGNLLIHETYDRNGHLHIGRTYEYNKYNDKESVMRHFTPKLKKNENRTISTKSPRTDYKYEYTYDQRGKMKSKHTYQFYPSPDFEQNTKYFYKDGKLVKELSETTMHGIESNLRVVHKYNKFNSIDRTMHYSADNRLLRLLIYKYDKNHIRIKSIDKNYWKNKFSYSTVKGYDQNGNVTLEIYETAKCDCDYEKSLMEYNESGLKIKQFKYDKDSNLISTLSWKYQLDKHGNWVSIESFINGEFQRTSERKIEYFK